MIDRRTFLKVSLSSFLAVRRAPATVLQTLYLQDVRADRATVMWTTAEPGQGIAEYWGGDGLIRQAFAESRYLPDIGWQHRAPIQDLNEASIYGCQLWLSEEPSDWLSIQTARPGKFNFLVFGDSGTGSEEQFALIRQMQDEPADLVLHTGDIVYPAGSLENYRLRYLEYYRILMRRTPFYPTPGNHDYAWDGGAAYRSIHAFPSSRVGESDLGRYYSFDRGEVHFVSLDSNDCSAGMLEWLARDLAATDRRWKIAYFHHPPYSTGLHRHDAASAAMREAAVPILERGGVQLVFNGHDHNYQRTHPLRSGEPADGGIVFVTTGGGGAGLYDFNESPLLAAGAVKNHYLRVEASSERLRVEAVGLETQVLDSFSLE